MYNKEYIDDLRDAVRDGSVVDYNEIELIAALTDTLVTLDAERQDRMEMEHTIATLRSILCE